MRKTIETFRPVADAIATLFAPHVEVVLYDLAARRIAYVVNALTQCDDGDFSDVGKNPDDWAVRTINAPCGRPFRSLAVPLTPERPPVGLMAINHDAAAFPALARAIEGQIHLPEPARGGLAPHKLRNVTDYCDRHLADPVRLCDLAALTGFSPKHFARAFLQSTGQPPHRWLIERRVTAARTLLAESNRPLSEIAIDCGFADQSHFTTAFRKIVGLAPGKFRRQYGAVPA